MIQITNEGLRELRDSNNLTPEETYQITDYGGSTTVIMRAMDTNSFYDESTSTLPNISIHYNLDDDKIDYMKDGLRRIEGYFDWKDNITGECSDIYFENAELLSVSNSSNVYCERMVQTSTVTDCSYIILGDGCTATISGSDHITVDSESVVNITGSNEITVGSRNTISINKKNGISIADDNFDMTFGSNTCIVGSGNNGVSLSGTSNTVSSKNIDVSITGDLNEVGDSRYVVIGGTFNKINKTQLTGLTNSVGNTVEYAASVDMTNISDNYVATQDLEITNKPPFVSYVSVNGSKVKKVTNIVDKINMQSDNTASVLLIDQQMFWNETGTSGAKGNIKYEIVDGVWTPIQI